ncbi:sensor histidine kinase [Chloroflexus sp.]|uniref:sensor histidine kinase n=1 Tax=Chloroflexus sp. TaxID=1904827 RepID=UPI00260C7A40|nr:GAF domain-containing sensor histidine kinase [uncultured Chloroflexus sp.]
MRPNSERLQTIIRRLLPLPALGLVWTLTQLKPEPLIWGGLLVYASVNIGLLFFLRRFPNKGHQLLTGAGLSDLVAIVWCLIVADLSPAIIAIQGISALRAWRYRFISHWLALIPALSGFIPVLDQAPLFPTTASFQVGQLVELGGLSLSIVVIITLIMLGDRRNQAAREWRARYDNVRREQKEQVASLEASNNDLRDRLRRMEALGESLRAINSSLSLDDVLRQILDSLTNMLGVQRIDNAALTLIHGTELEHRLLRDNPNASEWATTLGHAVMNSGRAILLDNYEIGQRPEWNTLARAHISAALSVPLFDPDQEGAARGALSVVSRQKEVFSPAEERYLTSFSIQAMIAIRNAELHVQLQRQQAMLSAVLNDMADGLIIYDEQGLPYLDNASARQALARSAAHNGTLATKLAEIAASLYQEAHTISREVADNDGEHARYYRIHGSLVNAPLDTRLAVLVLHDITDQIAQEQQRREFIAKVAHELNNPIHTLIGFLEIVFNEKLGPLNDQQIEFLREASHSARKLNRRIKELIDFNRSESGQLRLNLTRANVIDVIISTCSQQRHQVKEREIGLEYNLPPELPDIFIDEERIGQVLTNLIENAAKATPPGGRITVSAELREQSIYVHVTDTGSGIPPEQIERVFKPFYRLDNGRPSSRSHPGLGLGLAICKQFVEAHNGTIWIEYSEPGKGTRFSFSLPLQPETKSMTQDTTV